jgi:ribonuclease BN (tRNA processing enzyme)
MRLAFLGTGSAFSLERYNGAVVVDDHILLDGGAPLLPHMKRLGIDPGGIRTIFITHFHGDHILGLPSFMLHRSFVAPGHLTVVGPAGIEERLEHLFRFAWDVEWEMFRRSIGLEYVEAAAAGEVNGIRYETVSLDHGRPGYVTGYRLHLAGRVLGYAGDTEMTPALERLVEGCNVVITEATSPRPAPVHTAWEDARDLAARHPDKRFFFNHVFAGDLEGAVHDLEVVEIDESNDA